MRCPQILKGIILILHFLIAKTLLLALLRAIFRSKPFIINTNSGTVPQLKLKIKQLRSIKALFLCLKWSFYA